MRASPEQQGGHAPENTTQVLVQPSRDTPTWDFQYPAQAAAGRKGGPTMKGSYALLLRLASPQRIAIGKLGAFDFPEGYYLYLGSALGGLQGRIRRHLRRDKKLHWHIDFLAAVAPVVEVWWAAGEARMECAWAGAAAALPGAMVPAPGFGASDCRCRTHLLRFPMDGGAVHAARRSILGPSETASRGAARGRTRARALGGAQRI